MGSEAEAIDCSQPMRLFDVEEFRQYGKQMVDFVADYHRDVESFRVRSEVEPGYLQKLLPSSAPEDPESLYDVMSDVRSKIIPGLTHWASPNFFAYYGSSGSAASLLGDMLSAGLSVNGFSWAASPAATELETVVLDWLAKLLQLPQKFLSTGTGHGGGMIQGTACEAVAVALIASRKKFVAKLTAQLGLSEAEATSKLVAYTSDQAHSCVEKGAQIAGVSSNLRVLPTDSSRGFIASPVLLSKSIAEDVANGLVPFFLCATVGTTSSSAVDPLSELGDIALEHGMWFHVDGAHAGNACICPEFRHHLDGIEKADSFCINSHKWFLVNLECTAFWVKDSRVLVQALSTKPEYLRNKATEEQTVVDFKDWQIPLSRRFRSLKLWFVLRLYGASGLRAFIRSHVALAKHFESLVQDHPNFEIITPRIFSLVCFRLKPPQNDSDNGRMLNANVLEAINSTGKVFLTHTVLSGVFTLRMAIGGLQTRQKHVDDAWLLIKAESDRLLGEHTKHPNGSQGIQKDF